ncbi:TPM domain-containing protein [Paenibacillus sp. OSY-SE]|uniref:TPM domain-containing protein n=1 Tax=Paenibacillus sp. OSY-SE TaxID=1196323 RepID=UPI00031CAD47|nr:TPM domain-containing protein [Paenibacillus sp. OSY-SE]
MKHAQRLFLLMIVMCLAFPSIIAAANIPAKKGLIQDTAKMLSKEAIPQIEKAAQGKLYTFYVLTIANLGGADPASYATDVYTKWDLGTDDILLLLSKEDRRIEMNFNNAMLQEKIDALPNDLNGDGKTDQKLTEFVDANFIPHAKEGNFAKASIQLMKATHALKPVEPVASETGTEAKPSANEQAPAVQDESSVQQHSTEHASPSSEKQVKPELTVSAKINWSLVIAVAVTLLLLAALAEIGFQALRLRGIRKKLPKLMVQANHGMEGIQPFVGLSQGETLQTAKSIDHQLSNMLVRLNGLEQSLLRIQMREWLLPRLRKRLKSALTEIAEMTGQATELAQQVTHIEEVDRTLKQTIADADSRLDTLKTALAAEQANRGWPLGGLGIRQDAIEAELGKSKQLEIFDPLGAEHRVNHANETLLRLEQDVSSISSFADLYRSFPNEMGACRQRFEQIIQEHRLKLVRIDPYGHVEQARQANEQMLACLQQGEMSGAAQQVELMRQLLSEAVQMTQRQADLKIKNASDIALIVSKLAGYPQQDEQLQGLTERVRRMYRTKHWEQAWHDYRDKVPYTADIAESLRQVQHWCDEEVQEYEMARKELDQMLHTLAELDERAEHYSQLVRKLDSMLEEARRKQAAAETAYAKGRQAISRHRLVHVWSRQENSLAKLQSGLQQLFADEPYDLVLLAEVSNQFVAEAEQYLGEIERAVVQKRNAEREIDKLESRYHSVHSRVRRKINVSPYQSQYSSVNNEISHLMRLGAYDQAARSAATLAGIITAMDRAYDEVIREERRQEERRREAERRERERERERERQAQQRNNQSSSGSSWIGGSNSSGGSSWGDSSNSSSGSNWSNKNNNSSGGSNW